MVQALFWRREAPSSRPSPENATRASRLHETSRQIRNAKDAINESCRTDKRASCSADVSCFIIAEYAGRPAAGGASIDGDLIDPFLSSWISSRRIQDFRRLHVVLSPEPGGCVRMCAKRRRPRVCRPALLQCGRAGGEESAGGVACLGGIAV